LLSHCLWLLGNGCDGINLLGTTGEAMSLSVAQRLAVMEAVADSDVPVARVMVGTGARRSTTPRFSRIALGNSALQGRSFCRRSITRMSPMMKFFGSM